MKGFKGFNHDLQCNPNGNYFQFEIGKKYHEDEAELCKSGFHFCENPLDVFRYYNPADSRFCEIDAEEVSDEKQDDSKRTAKGIKIGAEIGIKGIVDAFIKFRLERVNFIGAATNSGDNGAATNSGDNGAATNSGDNGAATNSGYRGAATNSGDGGAATNSGGRGAATNSGYMGAATNSGDRGAATNSGDNGAATNSGGGGAATNSGGGGAATNSGDRGAATNSGYMGAATNSGDGGAATNSGDRGAATNSGYMGAAFSNGNFSKVKNENIKGVAFAGGYRCIASGIKGSAICLVERNDDYKIINVKASIIDGDILKENTFYELVDGEFIECEE